MKKNKIIRGLLFCMLLVLCLSTTAFAGYKVKSAKVNKWISGKSGNLYKISIPSGTYIQAQVKKNGSVSFYKNKKVENGVLYLANEEYGVLPKGTYYIYCSYKFKIVTKKYKNSANYNAGKASSLKAGKQVVVVQTPKDAYDRWYKIKLTKTKTINFWTNNSSAVSVLNSEGKELNTSSAGKNKYYTYEVQSAGTYYFCVGKDEEYNDDDSTYDWNGSVYTLKWK